MIDLGNTSWPQVSRSPLVLVPLGSTEQHGPHLPFTTDSVIAEAVACLIGAGKTSGDDDGDNDGDAEPGAIEQVVIVPTVPFGASGEHQGFPGTISIGQEVLERTVIEMVRSIANWGGRILFVNGHGGNLAALSSAIPQLTREGHTVAWVPCGVGGGDAHAGRTETSLMLHLEPLSVEPSAAQAGNIASMRDLLPALRSGGVRSVSANGILGDPTGATAREGQAILADMVAGVGRRLASWVPDSRGCLLDPRDAVL